MVGDPPPIVHNEGYYTTANEASSLTSLALIYHMDWEIDYPSEIDAAKHYLKTLSEKQKKTLSANALNFLKANPDDEELTKKWLEIGACGWLKKTNVRRFFGSLLLEL